MFALFPLGNHRSVSFSLTSITKLSWAAYAEKIWHDKITRSLFPCWLLSLECKKHPCSIPCQDCIPSLLISLKENKILILGQEYFLVQALCSLLQNGKSPQLVLTSASLAKLGSLCLGKTLSFWLQCYFTCTPHFNCMGVNVEHLERCTGLKQLLHLKCCNSQLAVWISGWPADHNAFMSGFWNELNLSLHPSMLYMLFCMYVPQWDNGFGFLRVNQYVQFGSGCVCVGGWVKHMPS